MNKRYIVTIDGPVGSGKSTVARLLAKARGLTYLDTGAMYRVVALEAARQGLRPDDEDSLRTLCGRISISFKQEEGGQRVYSDGRDVTDEIRTPEISMLASRVSAARCVREALLLMQRAIGHNGGIVVEGRDAGTVVFPRAQFKFYLDARVDVRAERRHKELLAKNMEIKYINILYDLQQRDLQDSTRDIAPLRPADDAICIDTSGMTIEDVVNKISQEIESRASSLP
jgi:cytidylate kinase